MTLLSTDVAEEGRLVAFRAAVYLCVRLCCDRSVYGTCCWFVSLRGVFWSFFLGTLHYTRRFGSATRFPVSFVHSKETRRMHPRTLATVDDRDRASREGRQLRCPPPGYTHFS